MAMRTAPRFTEDLGAVFARLQSSDQGLSAAEAALRIRRFGRNVLPSHRPSPLRVFARQLANPLLILLAAAALVSFGVGERTDAVIIFAIITLSVGLGFFNEWRSEQALRSLQERIRHRAKALRNGVATPVDVAELVLGDVVLLSVGDVVPADLLLIEVNRLECDEATLTGESLPRPKTSASSGSGDRSACAFMGTVVRAGSGRGAVTATGSHTAFGSIATRLGHAPPATAFEVGLRKFSGMLAQVTVVLSASIFAINGLLHRPLLESLLFALAIAVGLTPQLLPAIVTISLATGARRLAQRSVLVRHLVSIEDLGNIEVLFTDKTGTLTEGVLAFEGAINGEGDPDEEILRLGLLCSEDVVIEGAGGGNPLDSCLRELPQAQKLLASGRVTDRLDFDYTRRVLSVVVEQKEDVPLFVCKGAPESILAHCDGVTEQQEITLRSQFTSGARVVAIATRSWTPGHALSVDDEQHLTLRGFLLFRDPVKRDAAVALDRIARLGVELKVLTGDNAAVAEHICNELNLPQKKSLSGPEIEHMSDEALVVALPATRIFARVTPEQKSRIIRLQRSLGTDVGFLGDGVNDAPALHDSDVGISVDTATDVAKGAADIVLLEKDLRVLADGIVEGRRIFTNTMKYVLMATSSNFGNMFSAAGASLFLSFLPMLPTQILLNNFLYDVSEMMIPTDNVDEEMLVRPSHWDIHFIRRFMAIFGPVSSVFDFLTFGVMIFIFHAGESLFRTAWFVESLSTQALVIFVIRTRRSPFVRSSPSRPLFIATLTCVGAGFVLPFSPMAGVLGFTALPPTFLLALAGMVACYLVLVEGAKALFFRGRPLS